MKIRTFRDKESGKVGIVLIPEFCCEEETLIEDLCKGKLELHSVQTPFRCGLALLKNQEEFSAVAGLENRKGERFRLNPFKEGGD